MKKIKILSTQGLGLEKLELQVNQHLNNGWKLYGKPLNDEGSILIFITKKIKF